MTTAPEFDDPDAASQASAKQTTPEQRARIQQKLGRCILRLQQYELLCKSIMVASDVGGYPSTWEARHQARKHRFARMTLGVLVNEMQSTWLARSDENEEEDDPHAPDDPTEIWLRIRSRHTMDPLTYERTVAAMQALVAMRNDLVHHFLEQFHIWEPGAGAEADRHLERNYDEIDRHMVELVAWARHMDEARAHSARAMASEEFLDLLFGATRAPADDMPARVDFALIARLLREAEIAHARDGWTLLEDAIAFINETSNRTQYPTRYQCGTWRQLLLRSGAFEIERHARPGRSGTSTSYRSRPI